MIDKIQNIIPKQKTSYGAIISDYSPMVLGVILWLFDEDSLKKY